MVIRILLSIPIAVVSGHIGLKRLSYACLSIAAVTLSISAIRGMYEPTVDYFYHFVSRTAANLLAFVMLAITPAMLTIYVGRKAIVRLNIPKIDPVIDNILGAFFGAGVFMAITYIIWR